MGSGSVLWLLACSGSAEPTAAEQAAAMAQYAAALEARDAAACMALPGQTLQGECVVGVAVAWGEAGEVAAGTAACQVLAEGVPRDECAFQVVDAGKMTGHLAVEACGGAGQFQRQCLSHVAAREVEERILRYAGAGNERIVQQQVKGALKKYLSEQDARIMSEDMISRWLARRWVEDQPLSREVCGTISPEICAKVYITRVLGSEGVIDRDAAWRGRCGQSLDPIVAADLGLPLWSQELEPVVRTAWRMLCQL